MGGVPRGSSKYRHTGGVRKHGAVWELKVVRYVWHVGDLGSMMREEIGVVDQSCIIKDMGLVM